MVKKITIIGAGPGGLTAAMVLSHKGYDVTIFEKSDRVGGRNASLTFDGFTFDTGPTFLMMKFILDNVFTMTGRKSSDYMDFMELETLYHLDFGDVKITIPKDKELLQKRIHDTFHEDGRKVKRFFASQKKRLDAFMPILSRSFDSPLDYVKSYVMKAFPYFGSLFRSVYDELGDYFDNEKLKLCFTFQSKYLGMAPTDCPGFFNIIPYIEHNLGLFHVKGGLYKISEGMAKACEEDGCKIKLNTRVKKLIQKGNTVKGVLLEDGTEVFSDKVIVNADFAYAMANLADPKSLKKYSRQRLNKKKYSCSVYMMYLGVDKTYDLEHHNIFFAQDYWANIKDITHKKVLSKDISMYVQNAIVSDKTLAPKGKSTIYVLVPVPNNKSNINWSEREDFREVVLDALEKRAGLKDLRKHIVSEKVLTPFDFQDEYNVFLGATFNLAHTFRQMLYFRPHNKFEELENCFIVGGGTHPGSGLPTIYQSGILAAELIERGK
jgi:phytoene desaturase